MILVLHRMRSSSPVSLYTSNDGLSFCLIVHVRYFFSIGIRRVSVPDCVPLLEVINIFDY